MREQIAFAVPEIEQLLVLHCVEYFLIQFGKFQLLVKTLADTNDLGEFATFEGIMGSFISVLFEMYKR